MKTAKEMFEELGYELIEETNYDIVFQIGTKYIYSGVKIDFDLDTHQVKFEFLMEKHRWFEIEELQAINKQVEELGWLDE